jgi:hypothetical protein
MSQPGHRDLLLRRCCRWRGWHDAKVKNWLERSKTNEALLRIQSSFSCPTGGPVICRCQQMGSRLPQHYASHSLVKSSACHHILSLARQLGPRLKLHTIGIGKEDKSWLAMLASLASSHNAEGTFSDIHEIVSADAKALLLQGPAAPLHIPPAGPYKERRRRGQHSSATASRGKHAAADAAHGLGKAGGWSRAPCPLYHPSSLQAPPTCRPPSQAAPTAAAIRRRAAPRP